MQAVARVERRAREHHVAIDAVQADANALEAFEASAFDLVTLHYAAIPRTPDQRAVHNIMDAVAPGGTLLVVGHDHEPFDPAHGDDHPRLPFDPGAYVGVDDFVSELKQAPDWTIDHHDKRQRPPGSATADHHMTDIVLRARRQPGS